MGFSTPIAWYFTSAQFRTREKAQSGDIGKGEKKRKKS